MIEKKLLATYKYVPKPGKIWKRLPRVPMTQYLETPELNTDIMYSGYRPVMYPVKENPLFRHKKNQKSIMKDFIGETNTGASNKNNNDADDITTNLNIKKNSDTDSDTNGEEGKGQKTINKYLFGENNQGGIKTLGINGTWKYGPRVPSSLLPFNWWSVSSLGMECYPEWNGIPREVIAKLKPFDRG